MSPSVSQAQQQAAAMALACKRGKIPKSKLRGAARQMCESMTKTQLKHYAETSRKSLPAKKRKK